VKANRPKGSGGGGPRTGIARRPRERHHRWAAHAVKFSFEEKEALARLARAAGLSVSTLVNCASNAHLVNQVPTLHQQLSVLTTMEPTVVRVAPVCAGL